MQVYVGNQIKVCVTIKNQYFGVNENVYRVTNFE